jgi:hypothetical protein
VVGGDDTDGGEEGEAGKESSVEGRGDDDGEVDPLA